MFISNQVIYALPKSGMGLDDINLCFDGVSLKCVCNLTLKEEKFVEVMRTLLFDVVFEYRFSNESCTQKLPEDCIDQVCEISNSKWAKAVSKSNRDAQNVFRKRHFAIFLTNHGLLEVVADDFSVTPA